MYRSFSVSNFCEAFFGKIHYHQITYSSTNAQMFADLNKMLFTTDGKTHQHGTFIFGTDTLAANGSFLVHHFLHSGLKTEKHVILLVFEQTLFHYQSIGKKLVRNTSNSLRYARSITTHHHSGNKSVTRRDTKEFHSD
jgi:hypothetical protein